MVTVCGPFSSLKNVSPSRSMVLLWPGVAVKVRSSTPSTASVTVRLSPSSSLTLYSMEKPAPLVPRSVPLSVSQETAGARLLFTGWDVPVV